MRTRISYAQNGEDVRIWHAFGPRVTLKSPAEPQLTYVEVGANEPRHFSLTAALYDLGWRGLLIEADPHLAARLRDERPGDVVVEAAAAGAPGDVTFFQVPGTGLGTLDAGEADAARSRGFDVVETTVQALPLDQILDEFMSSRDSKDIHALSIDVEGAEEQVLAGLSLTRHRPWVICIEAVEPGTDTPSHKLWEDHLAKADYREVAFDGINRWYVANERMDQPVTREAGAPNGTTIAEAIATPMNVLDAGQHGWVTEHVHNLSNADNRAFNRAAWQRELILNDVRQSVPVHEYERQINELRTALVQVEGSRTFALSRRFARVGKKVLHVAHRLRNALPAPVNKQLVRERHLRHVTANMGHLTDSAYLGDPPLDPVTWLAASDPEAPGYAQRPPLPPGMSLGDFTEAQAVMDWLSQFSFDSDDELDSRMDNHDDEVGRVRAALRTRLRLAGAPANPPWAGGNRIAIDVRSLQSPAFGNRGIGRFAKAVLLGAREAVSDDRITLIVDRGLRALPTELAGECEQVTRIKDADVAQFSVFIEPSPMTHTPDPIIPLLHSQAYTMAVVFDFIPMHYPTIYLRHAAARVEYAAQLDALKLYRDFVCISHIARKELAQVLKVPLSGPSAINPVVAWPRDVFPRDEFKREVQHVSKDGPIVLVTGDEPRKNTFGGLAGIAAATSHELHRDVMVVGMAGQDTRVHHWSIAAAMRPGEARTLSRVSDDELDALLRSASCVVVPSFDEGLSLPVIEAVRAGVPVVASAIPSHQELVGRGAFSCDPTSPRSIAKAVKRTRGNRSISRRQAARLSKHPHATLEAVVAKNILDNVRPAEVPSPLTSRTSRSPGDKLSVGVATPWEPQRTGVADFSTAVFTELAHLVDLTVYTTRGARVNTELTPHIAIKHRSIDDVFADPDLVSEAHDVFISVLGNSHFHLPHTQLLRELDAIAVAHDTRMVEFYMALRGKGGVEQVMLATSDPHAPQGIVPMLDDQIDDMRLLQNAGFWEIAQCASTLVTHSPSAAPRLAKETGTPIHVLPFANQRVPLSTEITHEDRSAARSRLGLDAFPQGTIHLGSFGYIDSRTKMTDVVVEAAAWLNQWGHLVALHLVGSATPEQMHVLTSQARDAGLESFQITGFQTDDQFRDWLLAIDLGVQLRISPLLGVSGPLSDLAAFGTPAVASNGLCVDVDTPAYIHRLPDAVSAVTVAEAIEVALLNPMSDTEREALRHDYLAAKSPKLYAQLLLELIEQSL